MDLIAGNSPIDIQVMGEFRSAMLFTAKDIQRMFNDKNTQMKKVSELTLEKEKIDAERKQLQVELKEALAQGNVNIEEITNNMVREATEKLEKRFSEERDQMEGFLQTKIEKNLQLEVAFDEIKDAYRALESSMKGDDRSLR
jgi:hypothetical protein